MIKVKVGKHEYTTEHLMFEQFTDLGANIEEKFFPMLACIAVCMANDLSDHEILKALYHSSKDAFNKEENKAIAELVLNRGTMLVDGAHLDLAQWELHWRECGYIDYRILIIKLIKENLGNFTSLSELLPTELTKKIQDNLEKKFSTLFTSVSEVLNK